MQLQTTTANKRDLALRDPVSWDLSRSRNCSSREDTEREQNRDENNFHDWAEHNMYRAPTLAAKKIAGLQGPFLFQCANADGTDSFACAFFTIYSYNRVMTRSSTYRAAQTVSTIIETHYAEHLAEARARGETGLAETPSARAIETMIDAAFWASFRPEEGRFPKISLAFVPPEQARQPLTFAQRLPLTTETLTKLAPAVERPGIHLGVWRERSEAGEELYVWGATRKVPSLGFVLEDIEPGLLVIKHRRAAGFGKFANVAVLKGEQVKIIDEQGQSLPDCPDLLKSLHAFTAREEYQPEVNTLVQLAASLRSV